jgi:dTMP kinase
MDPLCEALLMFAARRDHLQQVIEPALARGEVVLCDRFTDATVAYQGFGRGFDLAVLRQLENWVQALPEGGLRQPELTVWFDLPPATAAKRLAGNRVPDRFESQPVEFFTRVAAGYAHRLQEQPARFARIASDRPLDEVWVSLRTVFEYRGWLQPVES